MNRNSNRLMKLPLCLWGGYIQSVLTFLLLNLALGSSVVLADDETDSIQTQSIAQMTGAQLNQKLEQVKKALSDLSERGTVLSQYSRTKQLYKDRSLFWKN